MGIPGVNSVEINEVTSQITILLRGGIDENMVIDKVHSFCHELRISIPQTVISELKNCDWVAQFRKHFHPFAMNDYIQIVPSWESSAYDDSENGRQMIVVEPGQAFGTGLHATTALAAQLLIEYAVKHRSFSVLDVGTGSGILSIIAEKNGASSVTAFDIDPLCSNAFTTHLKLNDCNPTHFDMFVGTAHALRPGFATDLVVMNAIETIIRKVLPNLISTIRGDLILTGVLKQDADEFTEYLNGLEFRVIEHRTRDEWSAFVCRKN